MQTLDRDVTLRSGAYRIVKPLRQEDSVIVYLAVASPDRLKAAGYSGDAATISEVMVEEFFMKEGSRRFSDGNVVDCSSGGLFAERRRKFREEATEALRRAKEADGKEAGAEKIPLEVFDENNTTYFVYALDDPATSSVKTSSGKRAFGGISLSGRGWIYGLSAGLLIVGAVTWCLFPSRHTDGHDEDEEWDESGYYAGDAGSTSGIKETGSGMKVAEIVNEDETEKVTEGEAPLSEGEKSDGRGGFDNNAQGYFSQHADTHLTSNRDVYFDGSFMDSKGNRYPVMLRFEIDDDWFPGVCWYHNVDYDTKLKMKVRFTEEEMVISGTAGGSDFVMRFVPTAAGGWKGTAKNGSTTLKAEIFPRRP